ncbi:zinc finger protein 888-like [Athalia rosae]|uniref:zinc finger protein 888-like n=1 Tax=Athalia rosae TaxID=37344 RepID=UPI002033B1D8|nr:zinc finger protein 888-like [Athalia rosae]
MDREENVLFNGVDGMIQIIGEASPKDISSLKGFLDYVETISKPDDKSKTRNSIKIEGAATELGMTGKFIDINLTDLMKKDTMTKSSIQYVALPETQNFFNGENVEVEWKVNEDNESPYRCAICQVQFFSRVSLDRHIVDLHLGTTGRFLCDICHKEFSRVFDLARHKLIHSGVKPFQCSTCQKQFSRQDHLKQHILSHSQCSEGEFFGFENGLNKCTICHKQLSRPQHLRTHMRQHLGTLFECDKCSKRFSRASHLRAHMRLHLGTCFRCSVCQKEFSRPSDLDRHKLTHLDKKLFECPTCQKKFSRKDNLKKHMLSHVDSVPADHEIQNHVRFSMNLSEEIDGLPSNPGSSEPNFEGTTCAHNNWSEKKFECAVCEKRFNRKVRLKEHVRIHVEKKLSFDDRENKDQNKCGICSKQLSRPEHLKAHMRLHLGTLFKCETCEKEFSRSSDLERHKLVHSGLKQFICIICHKQFSRKDYLKNHMLSHANKKSFECDKCKKRFTYFTNLRNHLHLHLGQ